MTRREAEIALNRALGRRTRWARECVYATGYDFSRAIDIEQSLLSKIETGSRAVSLLNLVTIANKLLTGTEFLLTGDLSAVEVSLRRMLIDRHPELLDDHWVPDPRAPASLLIPHRPPLRREPAPPGSHNEPRSRSENPENNTEVSSQPTTPEALRTDRE